MAKTLVIKLAETVENDSLMKLGEIRVPIIPEAEAPSNHSDGTIQPVQQQIVLGVNEPIQVELKGNGHFTDSTLAENLGTVLTLQTGDNTIYVSDGTSVLHIYNKYALNKFAIPFLNSNIKSFHYHWKPDVKQFAGADALITLSIPCTTLQEDMVLADFSCLTGLQNINLTYSYPQLNGSLSDIAGLTNLRSLILTGQTRVTGNISSVAGSTNLTSLGLKWCGNVTGNTSSIAQLHPSNGGRLSALDISGSGVTGTWPPATE